MSDEQQCSLLGQIVSTRKNGIEVHLCGHFKKGCTVEDHGIKTPSGAMPVCVGCPFKNVPPVGSVGSKISEILAECGIAKPNCGECRAWIDRMNAWGIQGCEKNRSSIIARLDSEAKKASWIQWARVGAKGYLSSASLLDEAIKRATAAVQ